MEAGQTVYAVGKIEDIFDGEGITEAIHTRDNMDGMDRTAAALGFVDRASSSPTLWNLTPPGATGGM